MRRALVFSAQIFCVVALDLNFLAGNWGGMVLDGFLLAYWALQQRAENAPLTYSELARMDGKTVWIVGPGSKGWCVIQKKEKHGKKPDGGIEPDGEYGTTWIAFRRPPQ